MTNPSKVTATKIWLASESPRRKMILEALGLKFQVMKPNIQEEDFFGGSVEATVSENARRKAWDVLARIGETDIAIAADTLVTFDDKTLSKPVSEKEVIETLRLLSGKSHRVLTGLALASAQFGKWNGVVVTTVFFRKIDEREATAFAETREPYDKAGGYGIQGLGSLFVDRIEGSYTNVMGLPLETLLQQLSALTHTSVYDWFRK